MKRIATIIHFSATESLRSSWIFALLIGFGFVNSAHAAPPTTFAQFDEAAYTGPQPFNLTNNGTDASFIGSVQGNFTFFVPGLPTGPQTALIALSSTAVSEGGSVGPFVDQPIDGATNTLKFTRVSDNANLLTLAFTGGMLGFDGDASATLSGNTTNSDTVTYTSDFLDFSGTTARSFGLNVSAINPGFTLNENGFLDSFAADLSGGFSSVASPTAVPEPSTWLLVAIGVVSMVWHRRRIA